MDRNVGQIWLKYEETTPSKSKELSVEIPICSSINNLAVPVKDGPIWTHKLGPKDKTNLPPTVGTPCALIPLKKSFTILLQRKITSFV